MISLPQSHYDRNIRLAIQEQGDLLRDLSRSLKEDYGPEAVSRVCEGIELLLREESPTYDNPLFGPSLFHLPGIVRQPFIEAEQESDLGHFLASVEDAYAEIKAELSDVPDADYENYLLDKYNSTKFPRLAEDDWRSLVLYDVGEQKWHRNVPTLRSIVDRHPGIVSFQITVLRLRPGAAILPHVDGNSYQAVIHMGLTIPKGDCALRVAGEARPWIEGKCTVFHDSFVHEAWNKTDGIRDLLNIDTWSPGVTATEKLAIKRLRDLFQRMA